MIDKFDYLEPTCPLCGGKEFYYFDKDAPIGRIPLGRIIDKVDALFNKNDYVEAGKLLEYWKGEAVALKDKNGELSIQNELIGFYRKQYEIEKGVDAIKRALVLVEELKQGEMASGATVFINCATAYKEFGIDEEALPLYERAEEIYKRVLDGSDARFGGLYNNMAWTLQGLGQFEKAEKAYKLALEVMSKVENGEAEMAITYVNLAHMYENLENAEKIRECMLNAYTLLKNTKLSHDGYYAFVLEKCAPSFGYFGFIEESQQMKEEAKRIYERS